MKHIPIRTCIVTKQPFDKDALIRITKSKDGLVQIDLTGKAQGRGAYISKDIKTIEIAEKKGLLNKALGISIPKEIFIELKKLCHE
jgi:predicted RNA-binding protein YlxR (DUF448 family)